MEDAVSSPLLLRKREKFWGVGWGETRQPTGSVRPPAQRHTSSLRDDLFLSTGRGDHQETKTQQHPRTLGRDCPGASGDADGPLQAPSPSGLHAASPQSPEPPEEHPVPEKPTQGVVFSSRLESETLKVPGGAAQPANWGLEPEKELQLGEACTQPQQSPLRSQRTPGVRERDPSSRPCPWLLFWAKKSEEGTCLCFLHQRVLNLPSSVSSSY